MTKAKLKEARERAKRIAKRQKLRAQKRRALLLELLEEFIVLHYGDPSKAKMGAVLYGPTIAALSAAATLQSFLLDKKTAHPSGWVGPRK